EGGAVVQMQRREGIIGRRRPQPALLPRYGDHACNQRNRDEPQDSTPVHGDEMMRLRCRGKGRRAATGWWPVPGNAGEKGSGPLAGRTWAVTSGKPPRSVAAQNVRCRVPAINAAPLQRAVAADDRINRIRSKPCSTGP